MGVSQYHLEFIANGYTGYHVANSAADGAEDSVSLLLLQPHAELKGRNLSFS